MATYRSSSTWLRWVGRTSIVLNLGMDICRMTGLTNHTVCRRGRKMDVTNGTPDIYSLLVPVPIFASLIKSGCAAVIG
jgi:hypothetical protein